jgi:glucan biosynthesis protein
MILGAFQTPEAVHVTLDYVAKKAEARAHKPFHSPRADLPDFLSKLTYDDYRQIVRDDKALWRRKGCRSGSSSSTWAIFTRSRCI